jgi:glycosyltransferase involved in cell wall biosynthesis/SAM-dependent methyltransferase
MSPCHCNYCGTLLPLPSDLAGPTSLQEQLLISGIKKNDCHGCGATVRERQLKFYFDEVKILQGRSNLRILHFNPEPRFLSYLANFKPELHILAMAETADRRYEVLNIESIPYDNDVFDLVIANDQLEVVASLEQTLNELNRVLKPNGLLVLQTCFSHVLKATWDDAGLESSELRDATYGNKMRQRLFGTDIIHCLSRQLNNNVLHFSQLSPSGNPHALDTQEPFMLFRKKLPIGDQTLVPDAEFIDKRVMVSILCVTYNQSAFIVQTLASFLEQKTNFRFEIVIGDDCSTDGTLDILRSWASQYPDVIKLLSDGPNVGPHLNWKRTYEACLGRYIAMCDGDDRWTDPLKLQKQFDYMESHTNCALTFGNVQAHKNGCVEYNYIGGAKMDFSAEILQHAPPINTLTVMFRNVLGEMPPEIFASGAGDLFTWSLLGQHGYGHYMPEILPSIYNQHPGGVNSLAPPAIQQRLRMKTFYAAYHYYSRIGRPELAMYFLQGVVSDVANIVKTSSPEQSQSLLGNMVSEISHAMRGLQQFDTTTLSAILDNVKVKSEDKKHALLKQNGYDVNVSVE